jgi:hypothetical protein
LKQSLAGGQSTEPVSATRLAPVSRQGFALQILAEQFTHFIRDLLYILNFRQIGVTIRPTGGARQPADGGASAKGQLHECADPLKLQGSMSRRNRMNINYFNILPIFIRLPRRCGAARCPLPENFFLQGGTQ